MKYFFFFFFFFYLNHGFTQSFVKIYERNPDRFIVCHRDYLQELGDYRASIKLYIDNSDTLDVPLIAYRMAVNYSKLGFVDSAFLFLFRYVDISEDDRLIIVDKDFDVLRQNIEKWKILTKKIEDKYLQELDSLKNKELALCLFYLGIEDQKYRSYLPALNQVEYDSNGVFRIYINNEEIILLEKMIKQYGFPTISLVGKMGSLSAFLVLQHSDRINKYYHKIKKLYKKGEINSIDFAMLTDRYFMDKGRKQLYGSQLFSDSRVTEKKFPGKTILWPVKKFKNINDRRKQMGFSQTVEEYVASWNDENYIIPDKYYKKIKKKSEK